VRSSITGKTIVAGVVGAPVGHSLSPILHNAWLADAVIDGVYVAFPVAPDWFADFVAGLRGGAVRGLNVTVPFKLAALAVAIGAALGVVAAVCGAGPWLGERRRWIDRGATAIAATPLLSFAPLVTFALAARLRVVPLPGDPDAGFGGLLFASSLLAIPMRSRVRSS